MKQNNVSQQKNIPPMLKNLDKQLNMVFDYEINSIKLDDNEELNSKMYYYDKITKSYRIVNYNKFWDCLNLEYIDLKTKVIVKKSVNKAWCLKRLVSKKKRRFENEMFDLDMTYITKRVIAMGYPATGFEKTYRNSIDDVVKFFNYYHNDNVKIYNLCIEKDRIYDKKLFLNSYVGLFPAKDHNPCPIKLILEFCVDMCLYLIKNPEGVAAVHCKAGKGRTGVMICSYLIFSGLCKNSKDALLHYAESRTYNKKGVTIPSQIRYIQYFESFLETNFCPPYIFLIPQIVKYHLNMNTQNVLKNFMTDKSYFISPNEFRLKNIKVGPLPSQTDFDVKICDFVVNNLKFENYRKSFEDTIVDGKNLYYFKLDLEDNIKIVSDIKISITGGGLDFYFWANLWYSTLNVIKSYLDNFHQGLMEEHKIKNISRANTHLEDIAKREIFIKRFSKNEEMKEMSSKPSNNQSIFVGETLTPQQESFEDPKDAKDTKKASQYNNLSDDDEEPDIVLTNKNKQIKDNFKFILEKTSEYKQNISEPNEDDNLFNIFYKLKHNTDLNIVVKTINKILINEAKQSFDKSDMTIMLTTKELDKFFAKGMNKKFSVSITYALTDY